MKTVFIASQNQHKITEIQNYLKYFELSCFGIQDLNDYQSPAETGKTFLENAFIKAKTLQNYFHLHKKEIPFILADDSGLECEDLNHKPGVYSARFAGENATDADNNKKLIHDLKILSNPTLKAQYVCALVWLTPQNQKILFMSF
jgi:XTP/dITP diphosphohydrolase